MESITENNAIIVGAKLLKDAIMNLNYPVLDYLKINIIFLCPGDSIIERKIIDKLIESISYKLVIDIIYLVDITKYEEGINLMKEIAQNVIFCQYDDMNKILLNTHMDIFKYTICLAIHPQTKSSYVEEENVIPILKTLLNLKIITSNEYNQDMTIYKCIYKLSLISLDLALKQVGLFYRIWLGHYHKSYAEAWRNGYGALITINDINLGNKESLEIEPIDFYNIVSNKVKSSLKKMI